MTTTTGKSELELCRCDHGSGGWSLHTDDGLIILSGPSELDENEEWLRPDERDYEIARQLAAHGIGRPVSWTDDGKLQAGPHTHSVGELDRVIEAALGSPEAASS